MFKGYIMCEQYKGSNKSFILKNAKKAIQPLALTHPYLLEEWDWEYNNSIGISPYEVSYGSHLKMGWVDKFEHRWTAIIKSRAINGLKCPYCSNQKVGYGNDLFTNFPELCKEWDFEKNKLGPETYTKSSTYKAWWKCSFGHSWGETIANRNNKNLVCGCPFCSGKRVGYGNDVLTKYPEICDEWDYIKNTFGPNEVTPGSSKKVWWLCKVCGYKWVAAIFHRINGTGCPKCSRGNISKISQEWLDSLGVEKREIKLPGFRFRVDGFDPATNTIYEFLGDYWHGNLRKYNPTDFLSRNKKITFQDKFNQTFQRFEKLKIAGYKIFYVWERDFLTGFIGQYV